MTPSDIDFYKDDLATPEDKDLYSAIEIFTRIALPQAERMQEGYLLDFKGLWNDTALKAVAAFANTYGGASLSASATRTEELTKLSASRRNVTN
jgi:hypothetical protein